MPDPTASPNGPVTADSLHGFDAFMRGVRKRLIAGREVYRDESFGADPTELLGEVCEELLDVCGWAYVTWCRVQALAQQVDEARRRMAAVAREEE